MGWLLLGDTRYRPVISNVHADTVTAKGCQTGGASLDGTGWAWGLPGRTVQAEQ